MLGPRKELRVAARRLLRSPAASATAVVSVALGVCVVTVAFSAVSATLLRPIPGAAPGLLRVLGQGPDEIMVMSRPEFEAVRDSRTFESVAAERLNQAIVSIDGTPRSTGAAAVTSDYFEVLGVTVASGRTLGGGGSAGSAPVVVSEAFRRSALAGDPDPSGRQLRVGSVDATVVGVAPPEFSGAFPGFRTDLWIGLEHVERVFPGDGSLDGLDDRSLNVLGRGRPGLGFEALESRLDGVAAALAAEPGFPRGRSFRVEPARGGHPSLRPLAAGVLSGMLAVTVLVLLIACANVANIQVARAVGMRPEMVLRSALGAPRSRLAGLPLAESLLLSLAGGIVGLAAAAALTSVVSRLRAPLDAPIGLDLAMDGRTLLFGVAATLLSGLASGALPALRGAAIDPGPELGRAKVHGGSAIRWPQRLLVALQLTVTTALLLAGGTLVRGLARLADRDPGFDRERIVTVESTAATSMDEARGRRFWGDALARSVGIRGVDTGALGLFVHLGGRSDRLRVRDPTATPGEWPLGAVHYSIVDRDFFRTLGIPLLEGRGLPASSTAEAQVVVNAELARLLWPEGSAVGRTLEVEDRDGSVRQARVVGVVATVRYRSPGEEATPFAYLSLGAWYRPDLVLHLRLEPGAAAEAVMAAARERVTALDADHPVVTRPMAAHVTVPATIASGLRLVLLSSGLIGLALGAAGVYGVVAHVTERRRSELAVRLSLGTTAARLEASAVLETLVIAAVAVGFGLLGGRFVTAVAASLVPGIGGVDPVVYVAAATLVCGVALLGAWLPARRVARRLNVLEALRP